VGPQERCQVKKRKKGLEKTGKKEENVMKSTIQTMKKCKHKQISTSSPPSPKASIKEMKMYQLAEITLKETIKSEGGVMVGGPQTQTGKTFNVRRTKRELHLKRVEGRGKDWGGDNK